MAKVSRDNPNDIEAADLLRARRQPVGGADRQDLREAPAGGRHPRAALRADARRIRDSRTTSSTPTTRRRWPRRALVAARSYASLAPAVPHALHMPSHTFTRVGSWKESIETNRRRPRRRARATAPGEELHALDYQTYAYLQIAAGQGGQGRPSITRSASSAAPKGWRRERRALARLRSPRFRRAMRSSVAPGPKRPPCRPRPANTPYTEAITHFRARDRRGAQRQSGGGRGRTSSGSRRCATR